MNATNHDVGADVCCRIHIRLQRKEAGRSAGQLDDVRGRCPGITGKWRQTRVRKLVASSIGRPPIVVDHIGHILQAFTLLHNAALNPAAVELAVDPFSPANFLKFQRTFEVFCQDARNCG